MSNEQPRDIQNESMTDEELLERMRKYNETMNVLSAGSTKKRQGNEQQTGNYEGLLTDRTGSNPTTTINQNTTKQDQAGQPTERREADR